MKKVPFRNLPGCKRSEGNVGEHYQAKRQVRSFKYRSWLWRPKRMGSDSNAVDSSPDGLTIDQVAPFARDYEIATVGGTAN